MAIGVLMLLPLAGALAPAAGAAARAADRPQRLATPTCTTASPTMIKQVLAIQVAAARRSSSSQTLLCQYASSVSSVAVVIQYNLTSGNGNYQQVRAGYDNNNEPTTPLRTLGHLANEAFTAALGSGSYAQHSVVALQGKLQVVVASSASISRLVALMRQILTVS